MASREYAAARASAEEVLRSDPRDMRAARIVAESYAAQNQPAKAVERLTDLAKAAPGSARLQFLLGLWQAATGNATLAREQFEAARRIDAGFLPAEIALAELDWRQGRSREARTRLTGVVAREPWNTSGLLLLAEIEKSLGNHAEAVWNYRAVLGVDSSNLVALNNVSLELADASPDEALGFAQHALEIAPQDPAVQDTLGWIYYRKGLYSTAAQYLKAAVASAPNPRRQFHLALSYINAGQPQLGRELMRTALRQDPTLSANARW
jgi:Tfp pilus assembly protein PilF